MNSISSPTDKIITEILNLFRSRGEHSPNTDSFVILNLIFDTSLTSLYWYSNRDSIYLSCYGFPQKNLSFLKLLLKLEILDFTFSSSSLLLFKPNNSDLFNLEIIPTPEPTLSDIQQSSSTNTQHLSSNLYTRHLPTPRQSL